MIGRDKFYRGSVDEVNNIGMLSIMNLVDSGYRIVDVRYDARDENKIGIVIEYENQESEKVYGFR